ncbi:MAG: NAD-dependent epimerase/dehydratase family protein, partial [Promethearchaeota archaeon]
RFMQKILVTGGKGYLGSKLVLKLKEKGYEVEIFDKPQDILNKKEIEAATKGKDVVYHLAALAEINWTDAHPDITYDVNITGTRNVVEACAKHKALLNFISTCCIYGDPLEIPSKEDGLINPTDYYATTKAAGEWIVKGWHLSRGLQYNIVRMGTIYGPSTDPKMRGDMCIQKFIEKALKREKLTINGSGKQIRNYIHIDDAVDGLIAIIEKGIRNETINLAGAEQISVLDIAKIVLKLAKLPEDYLEFRPERKDDFRYQFISIRKAKKLLGWEPKIRFEDGLREFYEWVKTNIHS